MNAGSGSKLSGMGLRVLSGVILGPLTLFFIILGGWYFMALILAALAVSFYEWARIAEKMPSLKYVVLFMGMLYLAACFISYIFLRVAYDEGAWLALCIIVGVWASDTGAYFVGKYVGGWKLAPRISPNKTWAGLGGAMFFCGLAFMVLLGLGSYLQPWLNTDLGFKVAHIWSLFFAGCVLGAVGQGGDLFISFFKRRAGVKDSGALIPGHGGLLDRIDSLLLVSPVSALMALQWLN